MRRRTMTIKTRINENLTINSASFRVPKVDSGKVATLTVKAGSDAASIVITDPNGKPVEPTKQQMKADNGEVTFLTMWIVTGNSGDQLNYTIRVYDADGYASVNTKTVTVTVA